MNYKEEIEKGIKESGIITNFFLGVQKHWKLTIFILVLLFIALLYAPIEDDTIIDKESVENVVEEGE